MTEGRRKREKDRRREGRWKEEKRTLAGTESHNDMKRHLLQAVDIALSVSSKRVKSAQKNLFNISPVTRVSSALDRALPLYHGTSPSANAQSDGESASHLNIPHHFLNSIGTFPSLGDHQMKEISRLKQGLN